MARLTEEQRSYLEAAAGLLEFAIHYRNAGRPEAAYTRSTTAERYLRRAGFHELASQCARAS